MELLNVLKKSENARKIFGKRELVIIEKQLNGVNLSPSEKTRLSRDIRKKFNAIKELSPYINDFYLNHGEITKRLINKTIEIIKSHEWFYKIKEIILFGSLAENRFHLFSDIDICVKFKENINEKDATKFRINILGNLPKKVDVQVYNILPDKVKKEINKNGKIIYKKRINEKVKEINDFIEELYDIIPFELQLEDYKKGIKTKAICERYSEKIIEAIEDLSFLIINLKNFIYPEKDKEVFDILFENHIISKDISQKLKDFKGMRNIIAHQYGKIDDEIIYNSIYEREIENDVNEFIKEINKII